MISTMPSDQQQELITLLGGDGSCRDRPSSPWLPGGVPARIRAYQRSVFETTSATASAMPAQAIRPIVRYLAYALDIYHDRGSG